MLIKALILYYLDLECYILIKADILGYTINEIISQVIVNDLGKSYFIALYC